MKERFVWKALGLGPLVDNVLAPFLPKDLAVRALVARCLLDVCILLLLVMVVLGSWAIHKKKKKKNIYIYMSRFWYLFWYTLSKTSCWMLTKEGTRQDGAFKPQIFLPLIAASNFLNYCVIKKASTSSTAIWAWHKWLQVGFICLPAKPLEWMKAGEV